MQTRCVQPEDEEAVLALWRVCQLIRQATEDRARKTIQRIAVISPEFFIVGVIDGKIMATIVAEIGKDHRGWLTYLAVSPQFRRSGYARVILKEAEHVLQIRGFKDVRLLVNYNNHAAIACYLSSGYAGKEITMGKNLPQDNQVC